MAPCKYTNVDQMWNAIAYNDSRKFAFMTTQGRWIHADRYFNSAAQLLSYMITNSVSDVHVKPLDEGGREWVFDADFKDCANKAELELKINVGATALLLFFADKEDAVQRVMFSGNRGFHMWLKFCGRFRMDSPKNVREHWFEVFKKPNKLAKEDIRPGNFAFSVQQAVNMYIDEMPRGSDVCDLIVRYWPDVDRDVFCNPNKQIRAPFSYNYKGGEFSRCLTQQLLQHISKCSSGCLDGGAEATATSSNSKTL
uniref:Late expression factor 1 n=1 Tax=Anticarsia gemmatalis multiple nucleopolyhedrovirus TaxID=268591 RepID=A0A0S3IWT9_9ABAC|nr:late expression factor 1 [Anticarsia gemmatalis multiple nucleopolyhedrovirus]ALR70893.1 late expression factor 1 [Anticarsia gemmatalis multiple nucleopolyhedrovirus]ALR71836.1 late expression factor 1 [Anticarsia gemmatalis multiple nucleopolyhedrovirus]AXE72170.1 late expression factor 1 [Anticarsia gemmatalis multiple nucleopolyhedrovirus]